MMLHIRRSPGVLALATALVALSAPAASAAGEHAGGHGHAAEIGQPGEPSEADRTVQVTMYDNYYEPEQIQVSEGETVRFVVTNAGDLVHEFNIGTAAMHSQHQEEMMMMVDHGVINGDHIDHEMMKMDMGDGQTMEHNDPNSVLLEPGHSGEIVWTFASDADLEFACNVPGHYEAGMMGDIEIAH